MNTSEDDLSSSLNGRLRPRKSNNPSPQSNKVLRKSDTKSNQEKPKRSSTPTNVSSNKPDNPVVNSDNTQIPHILCPFCEKKFVTKQTALKHARRIHLSSSKQDIFIECLFCSHGETESNDIIRHMVDSHPNQYFACLDCHTRFSSTSALAEHKLNVCEKQKLSYRSKLRKKSSESLKGRRQLNKDGKGSHRRGNKEYQGHGFNGIVISCELKPANVNDEADIEDNITTNVILPPSKGLANSALIEKNAVIVLDDIQWNKRIPSNFSFHNSDADQILSRLGVVHRSPRTAESTKRDWLKTIDDAVQKFEKCFDTSFYTKVASNVQENLSKYLDGSFNANPDPDSTIKTRKAKNCVAINTAEGFPILLACEQYSRNLFDGYMPRAIAPKHKWKWDSPDNDRGIINPDQIKRDSHLNNCIITLVSNLDIWTQLRMRRKFEDKFNCSPLEKKTEKRNTISKELKEILESRELPTSSSQGIKYTNKPISSVAGFEFPALLGLAPATPAYDLQPAVLSGEWVRPRCYVCCACGTETRDSRTLSSHISTQHPNALVQHYEIVGEPLLNAGILKHLYVPPSQTLNRTRPLRGFKECTKCKQSITLEDLHQHMLDCAGDTPTVRRKCRYRPFGVRKRRPRLPDNRIRRKMRKDIRTGQANQKNHMRTRPRIRSEVGDAETIRKMLADLPAKRHRVMVNPLNSLPRRKLERKRNKLMKKKFSLDDSKLKKMHGESNLTEREKTQINEKEFASYNDDDDEDNLPLKPKIKNISNRSLRQKESLNRKAIMNRSKRKLLKGIKPLVKNNSEEPLDCSENITPKQLSIDNTQKRINVNDGSCNTREHANREGSNHRESNNRGDQQPGCSRQNGNSNDSIAPSQNVPLKHSIARLTADSETHDKSVQFHRLFLVQQECNNINHHLPSDRRVLFENEAVVTKLDKPPLHFNQIGIIDHHHPQKNKVGKARKGLNDCIAMLKNKLVPTSDGNVPGHVSVQCGSDEPIEPEPIILEQRLVRLDSKIEIVKKSNNVEIMTASKHERSMNKLSDHHKESFKSDLSSTKIQSTRTLSSDNIEKRKINSDDTPRGVQNTHSNILPNMQSIKQKSESETVLQDNLSITQKQKRSESDISSRDLPSPPQRNTVIKKSPKVSMNVIHQDESKTKAVCANTQAIESNDNLRQSSNELLDNTSQLVMSEMNNKQQHSVSTKNRTESTINNAEKFSTPYSRNLNDVIMPSIDNEQISPKEPDFPQNLDLPLMHKVNSEYTATDYNDIPAVIPLAHASTTVESILSSPLDLSGKHLQIGSSENSSQEITFVMSTYDEYETLDLSNKSSGILQSFERNEITDMEVIADVVVDLSIKPQLKSACQSVPSNLSKKSTITDEVLEDLSYQRINENIPTDLSLKRSDRTSTVNLSEMSGTNLVQDLSSYKSNQKETLNNSVTEVSYVAKNLPTDLSGRGVKSKCSLLEGASLETLIVPNKQENNMKDIIDNLSTKSHSNVDYNHQLTKPNTDGNDYRKSLSEDKEIEVQEYHFTNYSKETHDTQSVNPLHLPKSVNSFELRNLIPESTSHSPELKIIPACENFKSYAEIMPTSSECNVSGSFSETNLNQSSSSLSDSINVVTHHDQSYREHEKPILSVAVSSIAGTVPLYTLTNRSLTTYVPVCKIESTTPVYTLGNACISVTRIDTSSSASLTNTLLSIPGNTISSTTSVYTLAGTTVDTTVNYGKVTPQLKSGNGSRHERCLPYCDRDSSGVHEPQSSATNDTCNDTYDLTKEEIIDCDAEQDTETARKIAMLPKELVEILGTMPIDHRNQLLNVLPQYVSTPIPVTTSPATQSVKNNTSMEPIRPSSSLTHQLTLSSGRTCSLEKSENKNITQLAIKTHIDSKTISSNIDVTPLQNLSQQSVALKSHVANDDCKLAVQNVVRQQCNQTTNKLTPFSNQEHNSTSFRDVQDAVIDLTEDENMQHNKSDVQVIKHTFIKSSCILENRKLEAPIKPKGSNDQTASLRAVRIKTPSERNKHMATEISTESENDVNISLRTASVYSSANGKQTTTRTLCDDLLKTEISNTHEDNKNDVIDTNFNLNKANISSTGISDLNKYRVAPCSLMRNDELLQDSLNHVSETKVTIATSSKEVSEEVSYEKKRDSSPSKVENIIIDIEDDNQDCQSQTRFTEKGLNSDEDSDDDISLAVIVKQKQRDQYMSSSCEKSKQFSVNPVNNDNKKRKRDKKSKKYCINDDNEEILLKKPSNSKNNLGNGTKFVEVSHNVITNKNHESLSSEYQVYNSNTLKSENEVGPVIDLKNAGYSPRNNRKSRRHVSVSKSVEEPNKIQKTNIYTLDINKNNDVIAECSLRLNNSESVESDHSITMTYDGDNDDSGTDVVEVAFRTLNKSTENVVVLSESKQKEKEESFSTTSKDNIQNVNKLTSEIDNTEVNDSTKKNTDNQTDAVFNKCNIICNEERKKSEAKVSSLFANNNKSILENVHKTNHGEISIEKHDCESKSKKSSRVKKIKNASFVELSLPQHEIFDSDESFVTPLRRSRRGKSMFIDSNLSELDVTNYTDNSVEQKAPLTKKQLIFSKLLLDEENHMKPRTGSVKEPIVVISNIKISDSHILSSRYTLDSIAKNFKEIKTSKRKKSPQSKRKCKKLKSGHNSQNDDISMSSIGINNDRESDNNIEKYHNNLPLNSKCCIDILNDMTSPTAEVSHTIPKQQNQSLEIGQNEINNKKSNIDAKRDEIDDRYEINIINKPSSAEKRKISCTVTGANCSSSKKSKPNNNVECASDSCNKDELKQNNELLNETKRKSRARNDIFDSSNKFGRNPHVPARRTRSKSVVVKSSSLLYDPYDIDLEDMIDKREPFGRKSSGDKAFENLSFMRDHDFKKRNKSETSVGVNTEPIVNGEFTDNVQVQTTNIVDLKGGTSDSDDSSKSDIPLKKYVEEKERKNLESNRNVILSDCEHNNGERDETDKSENKTDTKEPENNDASSSLKQDQDLKSEQFMESFGFFSERKPRKSNLLAMKKISETFHIIANETDDVNSDAKDRTTKISPRSETTKPNDEESSSRDSSQSPTKKPTKRIRKKATCTKFVTCYCVICKKEFRRPDNYLRHQMTLLHISKLSEVEMKVKTTPVHEEPNYLIAYKQQLDRLRILKDKIAKRKKGAKSTSKLTLPTLEEILANVNRTVREQQLSRRNLSRDEALFLDCCELLKESHKTDLPSTSKVTITSDVNEIITQQPTATELNNVDKNDEKYDTRSDGDVDSITAKTILESEEVRNLENDLISGLKEAAANSLTATNVGYQQTIIEARSEHKEDSINIPQSTSLQVSSVSNNESTECCQEEPNTSKQKKSNDVKDKMYPDTSDAVDIFEDKFDKIKRKCRSQAAAAKQTQPVIESISSHKGRKKSEKKKGKKNSKKSYQSTVLTKGALKGFDGIKVSIPTSDINMSAIVLPIESSSKKKKKSNSKKKRDKIEVESKSKNNHDYKHKITPQKVDVYEFMDNEDAELFEFRPSTLMERFKNIGNKDASTSKYQADTDKVDLSSESGSDGDDFVYDDYVCSDDETENSLMSCEMGTGKIVTETKKSSPSLKRKDVVEKNAVMGKIFKHNAVRTEKKNNKGKEHIKPKANLDQLFDSLLEDEPSSSSLINVSPNKDEYISSNKHEPVSPKKSDSSSRCDSEMPCTSTPYKKDVSKKRDIQFNLEKPSTSRKSSSISPKEFIRTSPKKHDSNTYISPMECEPSTSKYVNERRHSSKKCDRLSPRECSKSSPKRYESFSGARTEAKGPKKYDDSSVYRNVSMPGHSKDLSPIHQLHRDFDIIDEHSQDTNEDVTSDDAGVARQRARRKCTVGKQNVLAETWSSESEPDGVPPRPNSAESTVTTVSRKRKGKKKEGQLCGMRKAASRQMPIKRQDVESRVSLCHRSTSSASSSSSGGSRPSTSGAVASTSTSTSAGVLSSPGPHVPLGPPGPKVRPRSANYYWSSEGDDEQEHLQQHGWIVGDSHKKLVTMLAHAKGRKRNSDEKRQVIE